MSEKMLASNYFCLSSIDTKENDTKNKDDYLELTSYVYASGEEAFKEGC